MQVMNYRYLWLTRVPIKTPDGVVMYYAHLPEPLTDVSDMRVYVLMFGCWGLKLRNGRN